MKIKNFFQALLAILLCQSAGIIGSFFTANKIQTWYDALQKPFFNPPGWIFGPVWFTLYCLMGISLYLLWQQRKTNPKANKAVVAFLIHLIFNATWSIVFFGLEMLGLAVLNILIILGFIIYLIKISYSINKTASYLLVPYLAWVSFATLLNIAILVLN